MAGSSTISISETKAEALTLQSSAYGVTVPVVGGVNRVAGNLIWYSDFRAIPHTETQSSGKAGGAQTKSTTYTYSVSVAMGICHGQVAVGTIWRDKEVFRGGWTEDNVGTASEDWTVPTSGPMAYTMIHGETAIAEPRVRRGKTDLTIGTHYTLSGSVITVVDAAQRGKTLKIEYQYGIGDPDLTPLQQIGATLMQGSTSQGSPPWMTSLHPDQARTYPGLAYIHAQDYDLGSSTGVDNHSFEVIGWGAYNSSTPGPDCNPAAFAAMVLAHTRFGARMPAAQIDTSVWETYCAAAGLLMSPVLKEQQRAADFVDDMARLTNSAPVWSYDRLKIVPYGDVELSRFGVTYTPNVTPVYDLDDDCWIVDGDEDPIEWEQRQSSDRYNIVRVEYANRAQDYNRCIAEARDDADIERYGERLMDTVVCPWICDAEVARLVAEGIKQRSLLITGSGRVRLPWAYCLLEPMDLLTITDSRLGFSKLPVRITGVTETDDGVIELELEDWPLGVADVARYQAQPAAGYLHDYGVAPGSVDPPAIFEAPVQRTTTGLEVWAAVRGASPSWGGCRMWVSLDGDSYREAAVIYGPARYGSLTGPVAGDSMPVQTSGQLVSASADDASALETLVYVGGSSPEYMAYTTATLTGPGLYTLGGLVRGAFGTAATAHAAGASFVRVDDRIAKSGPLDLSLIGLTIWLKFTSFNLYQSAEQSIADVPAYAYTITGYMVRLPPSAPSNVLASAEPFGIRITCSQNPEPDVLRYEYRAGATWVGATVLTQNGGTDYLWQVQSLGSYTVWVAAVDQLGNYSTPVSASTTVAGGTVGSLSSSINGPNLNLSWAAAPGSFAIAGYEVRYGATWAGAAVAQFVQASRYTELVKWGGSRSYWVAVVDVKGNYGTPVSLGVTVNAPGPVSGQRADVVDNNALLYWSAPSTGDLPVDRYEVRKGATWAGGTVIGSNGNSTFTAVFEQQSGSYTYWVAAYDTAGNSGSPVGITATINQPPDYVFRASYNSAFAGTKSSMYLEGGYLLGPVNTGETWATHFSSRSWASPQDQVSAGFPIYAEPSTTSGYYEEVVDCGTTLPATIVTVTLSSNTIAGTVTATPTISWSPDGTTYTAGAAGASQVLAASGFRYVKVRYDFTCTAGANLIQVTGLNIKLANKLKTDSGKGTVSNATTGVVVNFNVPFIDADTPIVQPDGTTPLLPVVDFSDVPNPTSFTVYLYNTSGTRVTGSFSWTARGY